MLKKLFFAACLWSACTFVSAATILPDVVVTASRYQENQQDALYSTDVITREEIEAIQAQDAAEILQRIPSIQLGRNGGPGQQTSIFMRGTASDHTLVLLDGVPIQSGTTGATALQHLMPEHIERIEVVKGPASTLYGSSTIGGVIQIFTKPQKRQAGANVAIGTGSDSTKNISAVFNHAQEQFHASASVSHRRTNGYPSRSTALIDRGYKNKTLNATFGIDFADSELAFSQYHSEGKVEYFDFSLNPLDQDVKNAVSRLVYSRPISEYWDTQFILSHVIDNTDENQSDDFAHTKRNMLDWQNNLYLNNSTLTTGVTLSKQHTDTLTYGTRYDETDDTAEVYVQNTLDIGNNHLQFGGRLTGHDRYGDRHTWNAAVGHDWDKGLAFFNMGSSFRAPSPNDLYGYGGNPNLGPETAKSAEIGVKYLFSPRQKLSVSLFHSKIKGLIEAVETAPNSSQYINVQLDSARIRGLELDYQQQWNNWQWSFAYVLQEAKNLDDGINLARRAKHKINSSLAYQTGKSRLALSLLHAGKRRDSDFSSTELEAYTVFDLNASYCLSKNLSLQGKVHNFFDEEYELASGYPAQGRLIGIQLTYTLD